MDPFKQYLQANKAALDIDEPAPQVWAGIEEDLPAPVKKISVLRMISWAAAACVVLLAGVGLWSLLGSREKTIDNRPLTMGKKASEISRSARNDGSETGVTNKSMGEKTIDNRPLTVKISRFAGNNKASALKPKTLSPTPQTLNPIAGLEANFTQVINLQRARISTMPMYAESAAYFNDFKVQLKQMDKDEQVIKHDISKKGMNDELLDQLINLYQQKLNILKQLQLEMNKTNNRYKQNRGSVDTVRTYFLSI